MNYAVFRCVFALCAAFAGTFLETVCFPLVGKVTNLFWGGIYGLGLLGADISGSSDPGAPFALGFFLMGALGGPIIVTFCVYFFTGFVLSFQNRARRCTIFLAMILSLFAVVPVSVSNDSVFYNFPTWSHYFSD
ncbi:MAG: hypothetical protein R3C60_13655 [Parvularculaceae bacterium]